MKTHKIRETFTVIREYEYKGSMSNVKSHALYVADDAGEFLFGGSGDTETISVVIEVDSGKGYKKIDTD
jgi:hypothetical protein